MTSPSRGGSNATQAAKLHVLQVIGNGIVGGVERHVATLIGCLKRAHIDVTCLCPYESEYSAILRQLGCAVFVSPLHDDPQWRTIELTVELVRQLNVNLLHGHLVNAHTLVGVVGRMLNIPSVATIHSMNVSAQEIALARLTDSHLIAVCQETQTHAWAAGVRPERVSLIRNGVDLRRFTPDQDSSRFRSSLALSPQVKLIGYVGRLSWEKGPDRFVKMAQLITRYQPDVHFAMVGEGPMEKELKADIVRMGLQDRVHMAGLWRDMSEVYPAFDLLAQTSRSEAMPLALLEAMASGLPIVAIGVGGVPELLEHGSGAIVIGASGWSGVASQYSSEWEGVAEASLHLLADPPRLNAMGRLGRARCMEQFDAARASAETAALYARLVANSENVPHKLHGAAIESTRRVNGDGASRSGARSAGAGI